MNEKEYNKLLDKAFEEMSSKITKSERFEIPKIKSIIQGTKTIIKDFEKIIKNLRRDPKESAKFLANELATSANFNGSDLVLKGKFSAIEIQKLFDEFVKKFILCKECNKPDTTIKEQLGIKILKCEACGAIRPLKTK
jgi:translation initiation factor 2 subunit 2